MKKSRSWLFVALLFFSLIFVFPNFRSFFSDSFVFIKLFLAKPDSVGAIVPSSRFLANAVTKHINIFGEPVRILEVGAGTGSMTVNILKKLRTQDKLDIVELDSDFCEILNEKFGKRKNVKINCVSILDWKPKYLYDYIISGLPFNAFSADFLKQVLKTYEGLIKPGGIISYFEYIALAKVKLFFLTGEKKNQYSKTITTTNDFVNKFEFDQDKVLANIPPACVHHLSIK